jgi:hypothetical protein
MAETVMDAVTPSSTIPLLEDVASLEESVGEKKEETVRVVQDGMTKQIDDSMIVPDSNSSNHEPLPERNSRRTPLIHNLETLEEDQEMSHHHDNIIPQMNVYVLDDTPSVASSQPPLVLMNDSSAVMEESDDYHRTSRSPYKEPDTTLSLDKEEPVSDLDKSPPSDPEHRIQQYNSLAPPSEMHISARADPDEHADDSTSSNDDSSYFASHLPEPNSGRRYSVASNASSRPRKPDRESDASLSLSDDSDPGEAAAVPPALYAAGGGGGSNHHPYIQPGFQPRFTQQPLSFPTTQGGAHLTYPHPQPPHQFLLPRGVVPELYPQQQIMPPMHSYHSLASTSSQSDTSLPDVELRYDPKSPGGVPSGRRSPILGEHPPSRRGGIGLLRSPPLEQPSPPTILHSFSNEGGVAHPQPHTMTPQQWAALGMERNRVVPSRESDFIYSGDSDNNNNHLYAVQPHAHPHHAFGEPQHRRATGPAEEYDAAAENQGFKVYWQRWLMLMVSGCLMWSLYRRGHV